MQRERRGSNACSMRCIDQSSAAQKQGAIALCGKAEMVRDQHGSEAVRAVQPLQQREDDACGAVVEIAGELIGQQQPGLGHQRAGQRDALLLAPRQLAGTVQSAAGKFDLIKPAFGPAQRLRLSGRRGPAVAWLHSRRQ